MVGFVNKHMGSLPGQPGQPLAVDMDLNAQGLWSCSQLQLETGVAHLGPWHHWSAAFLSS